jgi:hypothetical protein
MANTLAYYDTTTIAVVKSYVAQATGLFLFYIIFLGIVGCCGLLSLDVYGSLSWLTQRYLLLKQS